MIFLAPSFEPVAPLTEEDVRVSLSVEADTRGPRGLTDPDSARFVLLAPDGTQRNHSAYPGGGVVRDGVGLLRVDITNGILNVAGKWSFVWEAAIDAEHRSTFGAFVVVE